MPVLALGHDDVPVGALGRDLRTRPLEELVAQPLTLRIVVVEKFGKDARLLLVLRGEEPERRVGIPHAARRIDAGRQREGERLRRNILHLAQKCRKGGAGTALDELEARRHDVAVLPEKGHAVRHRRERAEIEQIIRLLTDERTRELIGNARAA